MLRDVPTRHLRAMLALAGVVAALVAVARARVPHPPTDRPARDAVVIRGFHTSSAVAGRRLMDVAADELRLDGTRIWPFRLGFGHRLTARNARIELHEGRGLAPRTEPGRHPPARVPLRTPAMISSVRVDGLVLVLDGGAKLAISAARCDGDAWTRGTFECRNVRVHGDGVDEHLSRLVWDPRTHGFSASGGAPETVQLVRRHLARVPADDIRTTLGGLHLQGG